MSVWGCTKTRKYCEDTGGTTDLKTIRSVRLPVNNVKDPLVDLLSRGVSISPVVPGATAILGGEHVLRVVDIREWRRLDLVYNPGLKINENRPGDVPVIVSLPWTEILRF